MTDLKCADILEATGGRIISGDPAGSFNDIITDTRKITGRGGLFIPLAGEKFDGHTFISLALENGASGSLIADDRLEVLSDRIPEGKTIIAVKDTLTAMGAIAKKLRSDFPGMVIGITGSVGKTTTKEMISSVLSMKFKVHKTYGNYNNEIGLPLTIFAMERECGTMVLEMGMNQTGEIERLARIAMPDIAVITNIGTSHIGNLGSRRNILKAKLEILQGMSSDGIVVLNADDTMLSGAKGVIPFNTVTYGLDEDADIRAANVQISDDGTVSFDVKINRTEVPFDIFVPGMHNVYNALAAVTVGLQAGIPVRDIQEGLRKYRTDGMRMFITEKNGIKVINDSYNASPSSVDAALSVLRDMKTDGRKIAVLGDLLELGEWTESAHYEVGQNAVKQGVDTLVLVGSNAEFTRKGAAAGGFDENNIFEFADNKETGAFLNGYLVKGDSVLIKGSRGARMDEVYLSLTDREAGREHD